MRVVSTGFSCNNACAFCAQGELRSGASAHDPAASVARVEAGDVVAFVGGEPTLFDALPEWIAECDRRGAARVVVQTNGRRLAYPAWTERLAKASKRLELEVSLHGSTAAMHDYHTQVEGSFAQTVRGLAAARGAGLPARIVTVVTRSSFRHVADIVRLGHALGARALLLTEVVPAGRARSARDRLVPAPEMVEPFVRAAQVEAARLGLELFTSARPPFVGIGEIEAEPAPTPSGLPARVRLDVIGRPQPAVREARGHDRRTGAALREILPALFERDGDGDPR